MPHTTPKIQHMGKNVFYLRFVLNASRIARGSLGGVIRTENNVCRANQHDVIVCFGSQHRFGIVWCASLQEAERNLPGSLTYRTYGYLMVAYAMEKQWGAAIELALVRYAQQLYVC